MINKEKSFNKIFNTQPMVGLMNSKKVEKSKKAKIQMRLPPLFDTSASVIHL
jgi:hypothetical protein